MKSNIAPEKIEKVKLEDVGVEVSEEEAKIEFANQVIVSGMKVQEALNIQGEEGNWNYSEYMHGLYNGMEFCMAIIENRTPEPKSAPKKYLSED